jgi:hypothetical protein
MFGFNDPLVHLDHRGLTVVPNGSNPGRVTELTFVGMFRPLQEWRDPRDAFLEPKSDILLKAVNETSSSIHQAKTRPFLRAVPSGVPGKFGWSNWTLAASPRRAGALPTETCLKDSGGSRDGAAIALPDHAVSRLQRLADYT